MKNTLRKFAIPALLIVCMLLILEEIRIGLFQDQEISTLVQRSVTVIPEIDETMLPLATGERVPWDVGLPTIAPTPTFDPAVTFEIFTPEYPPIELSPVAPGSTPFPPEPTWTGPTPLPTTSIDNKNPYAAQNLTFTLSAPPIPQDLKDKAINPKYDAVWAPDGKTLALSMAIEEIDPYKDPWIDTKIVLFDTSGQHLLDLPEGYNPVWSPSGQFIAYQMWDDENNIGYISIANSNTAQAQLVTTVTTADPFWPVITWISNEEVLFYQGSDLLVFDLKTSETSNFLSEDLKNVLLSNSPESPLYKVSSLPQADLVAVASSQLLAILKREDKTIKLLRLLKGIDAGVAVFAPDGSAVAYVAESTRLVTIVLLDDETHQSVELRNDLVGWPLAWSPDSSSLLYHDREGLHAVNRDGSGLRLLSLPVDDTSQFVWSSAGSLLIMQGAGKLMNFMPVINQ